MTSTPALRFGLEPAPARWWRELLGVLIFWETDSAGTRDRIIATNTTGRRVVVTVTNRATSGAEIARLRSEFETMAPAAFLAAHRLPLDFLDGR